MIYNFDINAQIKRILKKLNYNDLVNSGDSNSTIQDFYDGNIYKKLLDDRENGEKFRRKEALTLMINTDGISKSKNSDLTIWPIFLVINELPFEMRFCMDNIIIAGLSVGYKKPDFTYFLSPIVAELKSLEYGIHVEFKNGFQMFTKLFLINSVFDKPARAAILNMKTCNGFDGCLKCYQTSVPLLESIIKFCYNL
jgi:hypothetical protein